MEPIAAEAGLSLIGLIAPTTPPARRVEIAARSRGFIYYISVAGITGERTALPAATIDAVAELRRHTDTPICVGFGISNADTVAEVCRVADGAIVGSAIVHRITDLKDRPPAAVAKDVGAFVAELMKPLS
ncbi:MAG: tryptophan synthase subunit alpha, partial [Planctomycetes bacterium]|nr:tryptophan synthase subunit alpha [Planctomycetota bacterium]